MINGTAVDVSEGSYFPIQYIWACEWNISTPDGSEWIKGDGLITGLTSKHNSYISTLDGQLDSTLFILSINISKGNYMMKTVCDGLFVLKILSLDYSYVRWSSIMWIWYQSLQKYEIKLTSDFSNNMY